MNVLDGEITAHSYVTTLKVPSSANVLMVSKMIKAKAGNANQKVYQPVCLTLKQVYCAFHLYQS